MNIDKQTSALDQEEIILVRQSEQKKRSKHVDSLRPHKGEKVWELDLKTKMISEAKFDSIVRVLGAKGFTHVRKKIIARDYCLYETAINVENARRKFLRLIKQLANAKKHR